MPPLRIGSHELAAPKGHRLGTHRVRSPAATLAAYAPLMPRLGITRLANITGLDVIGLPVFLSVRPNARSLATSQGKGVDADSARASALLEAIELWHAEHIEGARLLWDSYAAIRRRAPVVDVARLVHKPARTAARTTPELWIEGWDLMASRATWVPFQLVSLNFVQPATGFGNALLCGSNGLASGNHLLEAITHGLCEVIERHSEARWVARAETPQLDLASVGDPVCRRVLGLLERAGVACFAWDATSEIGVPAYVACVIEPPGPGRFRVLGAYHGYGCHLDPGVALSRALTEAVQSRLTFIAGSRDDCLRARYWTSQNETVHRIQWEEMQADEAPRSELDARRSLATETFEDDVAHLLAALRAAGFTSAVAVDLTRPDVGVPVVKIVVPGLDEALEAGR